MAEAQSVPTTKYTAKTFDSSKYDVNTHSYPSDLTQQPEYGGNYVMFYINVSSESKMAQNKDDQFAQVGATERDKAIVTQQGITSTAGMTLTTGLINAGIGAAAGTIWSNIKDSAGSAMTSGGKLNGVIAKAVAGPLAAAAGGAALGGAAALLVDSTMSASSWTREQKRLRTAIALHIPNNISMRYSVDWESEEMFGAMAASAMVGATGDTIAAIMRAVEGGGDKSLTEKEDSKSVGTLRGVLSSMALQNLPGGKLMQAKAGIAPNPMREQLFKGVDFRTFSFDYVFAPRSEEEAKNVLNIIKAFKYHMHPEYKDANNFLYIYPSEFDIVYYTHNKENLNIHRHPSCVLTDMQVNYTPNGTFTTFKGGIPTQINVTLTFKELVAMHKELIDKGM